MLIYLLSDYGLYFLNPDDSSILSMMLDTSPWSPWSVVTVVVKSGSYKARGLTCQAQLVLVSDVLAMTNRRLIEGGPLPHLTHV